MLISCKYCGRIHERGFECEQKKKAVQFRFNKRGRTNKDIDRFHSSYKWTRKSKEIRARDKYICQVCKRQLYNPYREIETEDIEVHHIIPVCECWDMRLDNDILISLCRCHHEMAEQGLIPRDVLLKIAKEQEESNE